MIVILLNQKGKKKIVLKFQTLSTIFNSVKPGALDGVAKEKNPFSYCLVMTEIIELSLAFIEYYSRLKEIISLHVVNI